MRQLTLGIGGTALLVLFALTLMGCQPETDGAETSPVASEPDYADRVHVSPDSDASAIALAQDVMKTMGGWEAWDATRFVSWHFFGRRVHYWDRATGNLRLEFEADEDAYIVLMNLSDRQGRAWKNGERLEGEELGELLDNGYSAWVNDSYWMFMPYKLLDAGVTLKDAGAKPMADGRSARVLDLTFADGTGITPKNRYEVYVADDTGLVEQWDFYLEAGDAEPRFASPWSDWKSFGAIRLATNHGRNLDWKIAVHDDLPASVFDDPAPVILEQAEGS